MKKLAIMFGVVVLFLSIFILLLSEIKDKPYMEKTLSIKSQYAYLSDEKISFIIKVYSNLEDSLLMYANKANVKLHDRAEENVVSVTVLDSSLTNSTVLADEVFYEYSLNIEMDIDSLCIKECYMTLEFARKTFIFNVGSLDISAKKSGYKQLKITNLYGLTKEDDLSLSGYIITFNNTTNISWKITNISIGNVNEVILNSANEVTVSDSNKMENYSYIETSSGAITVSANKSKTYILPVKNSGDLFLYNTYLLMEINNEKYYISNFNYVNSNDLNQLEKYLESGIIYEF